MERTEELHPESILWLFDARQEAAGLQTTNAISRVQGRVEA